MTDRRFRHKSLTVPENKNLTSTLQFVQNTENQEKTSASGN